MPLRQYDTVIIGGGIYGCALALHLKQAHERVLVLEKEPDLLRRASYANQARVHNGYHYPRSILTALRSRVNFARFVHDYRDCIDDRFEKYYAVGKAFSKITAAQFRTFCQRIGAPVEPAPRHVKQLFNPHLIEDVFRVQEYAFDALQLKEKLAAALQARRVEVRLETEVGRVAPARGAGLEIAYTAGREAGTVTATRVFNCAYSQINRIHAASDLPIVPLKHELTELALVAVPDCLRKAGVTVMCGPFFSLMPFPPEGLHTLSHVRYTPHHSWLDAPGACGNGRGDPRKLPPASNYPSMIRDAARYLPALQGCRHAGSIWEVKTVLPSSEVDDSRPILFLRNPRLLNFITVLGGKVDNIYDLFDEVPTAHPEEYAADGCQ